MVASKDDVIGHKDTNSGEQHRRFRESPVGQSSTSRPEYPSVIRRYHAPFSQYERKAAEAGTIMVFVGLSTLTVSIMLSVYNGAPKQSHIGISFGISYGKNKGEKHE